MEAPELHGGGHAQVPCPAMDWEPDLPYEPPQTPNTPTPACRAPRAQIEVTSTEYRQLQSHASQDQSQTHSEHHIPISEPRTVLRHQKRARKLQSTRRDLQAPPGTTIKEVQTLLGGIEHGFEQQAQSQQQARQNELEWVWKHLREEIQARDASQQAREENYNAVIDTLRIELNNLRTELTKVQKALEGSQGSQGNMLQTLMPRPPPPPQRPATSSAQTTMPAPTGNQSLLRQSQQQKPQQQLIEKKRASYADLAALLATKSGGKDWQTVPAKPQRARKPKEPTPMQQTPLTPAKEHNKEARRLIFRRNGGQEAPKSDPADIILALNQALSREGLPSFIRAIGASYTATGAVSTLLERGALSTMLLPRYRDLLLAAARQADPAVISVEAPEQWYRLKVHGVPTKRYLTLGLGLARQEIETSSDLRLKRDPTWLRSAEELRRGGQRGSTIVVTVGCLEDARKLRINGIRFGGSRYRTEHYWELGPGTICPRCCGIGHQSFKACGDQPPKCFICAGPHEGLDHACTVTTCTTKPGTHCQHMPAKCGNCEGNHPATASICPKQREARRRLHQKEPPQTQASDQDLIPSSPGFAVIVPVQQLSQPLKALDAQGATQPQAPGTPQTPQAQNAPRTPEDQMLVDATGPQMELVLGPISSPLSEC